MTIGHALQDVSEPGKGLDVIELCGGDEGADGCSSNAAAVRAREQMVFAPERYCPFILPMSGRSWKSTNRYHPYFGRKVLVRRMEQRSTGQFLSVQGPAGIVVSIAGWTKPMTNAMTKGMT